MTFFFAAAAVAAAVTQAVQLGRISRKKTANLLWLNKLQEAAHLQRAEREALEARGVDACEDPQRRQQQEKETKQEALRQIGERNISATQLLERLGFCEETRRPPNKKITGTDDIFRSVRSPSRGAPFPHTARGRTGPRAF